MNEAQTTTETGPMPAGDGGEEALVHRFIEALGALEARRELEPIVALHAEGCDVGNLASPRTFHGRDGAREFWLAYRETFGELRSEFRAVIAAGGRAALEWRTTGTSAGGRPIDYEGVSILDWEGDKIRRFRAYFDPSELGHQVQGD